MSLFSQLTEEHNEELREIREGYEIKLKEMEKVWPLKQHFFFMAALASLLLSLEYFFHVLCLFV